MGARMQEFMNPFRILLILSNSGSENWVSGAFCILRYSRPSTEAEDGSTEVVFWSYGPRNRIAGLAVVGIAWRDYDYR
jgi:hypothetical protein